jgi:hypothetical protein
MPRYRSSVHASRKPTWRALLRAHQDGFLAWVRERGILERSFSLLADDLERYTLGCLDEPAAGAEFMAAIPDIIGGCNGDIYNKPLRAEAYAFIHMLERYRRSWRVLAELTRAADLPLARHGVRTLDVGTGPAPVLFAVNDFYGALSQYAGGAGIDDLRLPPPELDSLEGSQAMESYVHRFCEASGRTGGPYRATFREFSDFDPAALRAASLQSRIAQVQHEEDVDLADARRWVHDHEGSLQGAFTYRLCVFSNFLTTPTMIERYEERLDNAFNAVTPGGVAAITGATNETYQNIYAALEARASAAGLSRLSVAKRFPPPANDPLGSTIKRVYSSVWARLTELGVADKQPVSQFRSLWDPTATYSTTTFSLRAFRRPGTHG